MNPRMSRRLAMALLLLVASSTLGCGGVASDGGPIGSGITATVIGNVIDVIEPSGSPANAGVAEPLPEVEVSIDGRPDAVTRTDAGGAFELTGDVAGDVTLRFTTGRLNVATALSVAADSTVSLADIELSPDGVQVGSARQLDFIGNVRSADCTSRVLVVEDLADQAFEIVLLAETEFLAPDGSPLDCSAATPRTRLAIDGVVEPGELGRVTALRIVVNPAPNARLEGLRTLVFFGFAVAVNCSADGVTGRVAIEDELGRTRVRILPATSILRPDRSELACVDIHLGDQIAGIGILASNEPGEIRADRLVVSRRPRPDVQLGFVGFLTRIDCASGDLELFYGGALTEFLLLPSTVMTPPLDCEELELGYKLKGTGRLALDGRDVIEMVRVQVERR